MVVIYKLCFISCGVGYIVYNIFKSWTWPSTLVSKMSGNICFNYKIVVRGENKTVREVDSNDDRRSLTNISGKKNKLNKI